MAIVAYNSHKIVVVYNTKCAQTTLYDIFGMPWAPEPTDYFSGHESDGDLAKLSHFVNTYPDYYVINFVRNPYSRLVSMYKFSKTVNRKTFPEFTEYVKGYYDSWKKNDLWTYSRLIPLHFFVEDQFDKIDFIGRQETLSKDVEFIAKKYGIEFKDIPWNNKSDNVSGIPWKERYTPETIDMASEIFQKDIEMFGYKF